MTERDIFMIRYILPTPLSSSLSVEKKFCLLVVDNNLGDSRSIISSTMDCLPDCLKSKPSKVNLDYVSTKKYLGDKDAIPEYYRVGRFDDEK